MSSPGISGTGIGRSDCVEPVSHSYDYLNGRDFLID
jgi:hypothetical protein